MTQRKARAGIQHAKVYCPMCTHTVDAAIERNTSPGTRRRTIVTPGQKCSNCFASLDAGYILPARRAA